MAYSLHKATAILRFAVDEEAQTDRQTEDELSSIVSSEETSENNEVYSLHKATSLWRLVAAEQVQQDERKEKPTKNQSEQVRLNVSYTVFGQEQSETKVGNNEERRPKISPEILATSLEDTKAFRPRTPPSGTGAIKKIPLQTAPPWYNTMEAINEALYETTADTTNNAVLVNEEAQHSKAVKKIQVSRGTQTIQEGKFGLVDRAVGEGASQIAEVDGAAAVADTFQA